MPSNSEGRTPTQSPPEALPDDLAARLRELDDQQLRAVVEYARSLLPSLPTATELVEKECGEEILDVEERDGHTKVVKKQECATGCEECPHGPYLFHVRVERNPLDGDPSLNWKYIGPADT